MRVTARNASGHGAPSEEASDAPGSGAAGLDTPLLQTPEMLHHRMVKLDWEDVDGADEYEVQLWDQDARDWADLPTGDVSITFNGSSAVVSGLPEGQLWFLKVRAVGCGGPSEWSEGVQISPTKESDWEDEPVPAPEEGETPELKGCPPGTPVLGTPKTLHHRQVELAWEDVDGADGYEVQLWDQDVRDWVDLPTDDVSITFNGPSAVVSGLPEGQLWFLKVRAVNAAGVSEWSEGVQISPTKASDWESEGDNSPATGLPTISGTAQAGETLTADTSGIADADGLDNATFSYQWVRNDGTGDADTPGATASTYTLSDDDAGKAIKVRVSFTDDSGNEEALTSAATAVVTAGANSPATGAPTISGTAQVGETLTADVSGIADQDGLDNVTFTYRWLADEEDISGANESTYTLSDSDRGKAIKVKVTFTDDEGNEETLTSAATDAVAGPPSEPLTASLENTPESHDGQTAFTFELRFSEEFGISYKTLRDHAFTVPGGTVTKAKRLERPGNIRWEIHVQPDSDADVTIVLPITEDCDAQGAICTGDGRPQSNRLELTVSGPSE